MQKPVKPSKPRPDFVLFAHQNGQWCKKVKQVLYYFGSWSDDPTGEQAESEWHKRRAGIEAGLDRLRVEAVSGGWTLGALTRKYLEVRNSDLLTGHLSDEQFKDYTRDLLAFAGLVGVNAQVEALTPEHFAKYADHLRNEPSQADPTARGLGPHAFKRTTANIKAMFKYAAGEGWIKLPAFGNSFKAPDTTPEGLALVKRRRGEKVEELIYEPNQIADVLRIARRTFKAMLLLGLNGGMGPSDIARLEWADIDFGSGRLSTYRGKTGMRREFFLWKKTRRALLALPRKGELVFYTRNGKPYVRRERVMKDGRVSKIRVTNAITGPFKELLKRAGVSGLTFYNLRHTYRTHADNCVDTAAVDRTMGHALKGAARSYRRKPLELIRLKRVAKVVYKRVFPKPQDIKAKSKTRRPVLRLVGGDGQGGQAA